MFWETKTTYLKPCALFSGCARHVKLFTKSFFGKEIRNVEEFYVIRYFIHLFLLIGYYLQFYFIIIRKDACEI